MSWHLDPKVFTGFVARRYLPGDSFEDRSPFASVAHVEMLGDGTAFISAFLNDSGKGEISRSEWLALRDELRAHGIQLVESKRKKGDVVHNTGPAPLS